MADECALVKGYMLVHLQELFEDVEMYGCKSVREYHPTWLQLLEQGLEAWREESKTAQLCHLVVGSKPSLSSRVPPPFPPLLRLPIPNPQHRVP